MKLVFSFRTLLSVSIVEKKKARGRALKRIIEKFFDLHHISRKEESPK